MDGCSTTYVKNVNANHYKLHKSLGVVGKFIAIFIHSMIGDANHEFPRLTRTDDDLSHGIAVSGLSRRRTHRCNSINISRTTPTPTNQLFMYLLMILCFGVVQRTPSTLPPHRRRSASTPINRVSALPSMQISYTSETLASHRLHINIAICSNWSHSVDAFKPSQRYKSSAITTLNVLHLFNRFSSSELIAPLSTTINTNYEVEFWEFVGGKSFHL